jgi:hypothetical protein
MVFAYIALAALFVATLYSLTLTVRTYMYYRGMKLNWRHGRRSRYQAVL